MENIDKKFNELKGHKLKPQDPKHRGDYKRFARKLATEVKL